MSELELQLRGYRLTTAEILYFLPDHPLVLQTFIWQHLDISPRYPRLRKFLDFWEDQIEARLHSVTISANQLIRPAEFKAFGVELQIQ